MIASTGHDAPAFVVDLPDTLKLLNRNDRFSHWEEYRRTQAIKTAAFVTARNLRIPSLQRAAIAAVLHVPDDRPRDPHNWQPTAKAAIDGLVKARILLDDHAGHLVDQSYRLGEHRARLSISLHITPVTNEHPEYVTGLANQ